MRFRPARLTASKSTHHGLWKIYIESKQIRMKVLSGIKKDFSREREQTQAVKNRIGSQSYFLRRQK